MLSAPPHHRFTHPAAEAVYEQLRQITLVDPHTHVDPRNPGSGNLFDILGYHYYTELAHSAGLPRERIEDPQADPKEKVGRMMEVLGRIDNTVQWSWMLEMATELYGWGGGELTADNWEPLYDAAQERGSQEGWVDRVLGQANVEAVFLTSEFDDKLDDFDTAKYVPCLRTDDLVFHLAKPEIRRRLEQATALELNSVTRLDEALGRLFSHFCGRGARACAISLPPDFSPTPIDRGSAEAAWLAVQRSGEDADAAQKLVLSHFVFWRLAELCREYRLPFDLMIGVNRKVYPAGVHQGQDLFDSRVSLIQYAKLFQGFPEVTFPVSVLASSTNQELTSYAWIFPNVVTNGHWWYSNTPSFIRRDLHARIEAVPRTKQVGYYSDAYKVEFIPPKFAMYRRILAEVLAEEFVLRRGWGEERAVELGRDILRGNVDRIFYAPGLGRR